MRTLLLHALSAATYVDGFLMPHLTSSWANSLTTELSRQPLADISTTVVASVQSPVIEAASQPHMDLSTLAVGFGYYAFGMLALTYWDEHVLPSLMDPDSYNKWTGLTHPVHKKPPEPISLLNAQLKGLPSLDLLREACVNIGSTDDYYNQYLCAIPVLAEHDDGFDGCEVSSEFSEFYGTEIELCRRMRR